MGEIDVRLAHQLIGEPAEEQVSASPSGNSRQGGKTLPFDSLAWWSGSALSTRVVTTWDGGTHAVVTVEALGLSGKMGRVVKQGLYRKQENHHLEGPDRTPVRRSLCRNGKPPHFNNTKINVLP